MVLQGLFVGVVKMAVGLNKVNLIGNVGRDPDIRSTNEGKEIVVFSLATTEAWRDRATGEKRERTEWHKIVVFHEGIVSIAKNYVKKGVRLFLQGNLQTRKWVDGNGVERYTTEIVLQSQSAILILLDGKQNNDQEPAEHGQKSEANASGFNHNELDDEIPF